MEWQTVNRKGGGKGWNHGVQDQLMQSMTAMQNSISQLAQSICTRPPPGSKGQGKGKPSKGQGKGARASPGERKSPNLKPEEERAEPTTEEVKCPKCPNTYNWTTRAVCRSCGCKLPQGNVSKTNTPPKSTGPASVKTGGGGSSSGASSGTSYASVVKGEAGPAESAKEEKNTQQKKVESIEKLLATLDKDRSSPRGSRNSVGPAPSCTERPPQPGSETRFSHGKNAQSQSQGAEMRRTTPPGGSFFASCPCRRRRGQLRAEGSTGKCCPQTARTPPGGCSYAIVLRGHKRPNRYVKAVRPSSHGRMRRRLRGACQKGSNRPLWVPQKTPREIAKLANPALVARLANSVSILQDAVKNGGDGSLEETLPGDPEALRGLSNPPPPPNPAAPVSPFPPPESARRKGRSQRDSEGHRDTEPAQCADAGLNLPREGITVTSKHPHASTRSAVFRKPHSKKILDCPLSVALFPGKKTRDRCYHVSSSRERLLTRWDQHRPGRISTR